MADPVTQAQFYRAMQDADEKNQERHGRLRDAMADGFRSLEVAMKEHAAEDQLVARDVLTIKTERAIEAKQALRRGTWAGILASAGLTGVLKAIDHLAGWR